MLNTDLLLIFVLQSKVILSYKKKQNFLKNFQIKKSKKVQKMRNSLNNQGKTQQ